MKRSLNEGTYTSRSCHILTTSNKIRHCAKCLKEEALQWKNIARNHGDIDIILILEKPSSSLLPSNTHQGKCAAEIA